MKTFLSIVVAALPLLVPGVSLAQSGSMMGRGMGGHGWMGGYGGIWVPVLAVVVVVALLAWLVTDRGK